MSKYAQDPISFTINSYGSLSILQNNKRERSSEAQYEQLQEAILNPLDYNDSPQGSSSSHSDNDEMLNTSFRIVNREKPSRRSSISSATTNSIPNAPNFNRTEKATPYSPNRGSNEPIFIKFKDSKKNYKSCAGNPSKKPKFESIQDPNSLLPGSINHSKYERYVKILNKEAEELVSALAPIKEDYCLRQCTINKITQVLEDAIPKSVVEDFDGFNSKLSLPNEGLDLGIFIPSEVSTHFTVDNWVSKINTLLCTSELAYNHEPLTIDGLPIIKFKVPNFEYKIYLSIHLNSDQVSTDASLRCSKEYPGAKQLYLLVKYFLCNCKNPTYSCKLESHTIFFMSIYFLQNHKLCRSIYFNPLKNLGLLFFEFLDYYGNKFDRVELNISTDNEGVYKVPLPSPKIYKKVKVSEYNLEHHKNRVSYSSFSYNSIKNEFIYAHKALVNELMYVEVKYRCFKQLNGSEPIKILGKILTISNEDSQRKILAGNLFKQVGLCLEDFLSIRDQNRFY